MITNVTGIRQVPPTPTFTERLADWRAKTQPQLGNAYPWKWLTESFRREFGVDWTIKPLTDAEGEAYAREECANGRANEYDDRGFLVE